MAAIGRLQILRMGTLKAAIVGFAILLAVAAWIVALVVTDADQDQQIREAEARASNLALVFEEQVYRQILSIDQGLRVIKSDWERNPAAFDYPALARGALSVSDLVSELALLDSHGRVIAATRRELLNTDLSGRRYFQLHRAGTDQGPLITGPFQSNGTWSLSVSRRLNFDRGGFGGVVAAAYDLDSLTRDMASADLGPHGMIMLVGRDGMVRAISLTGRQEPGGDIKASPLYRAVFDGGDRVWTGPSGPDRDTRIHAWRQIPGQDLVLVVGLDRAAALGGAELLRRETLVGTAVLTLLVLVMAGGVAATISSAVSREQRMAEDREVLEAANLRLAEAREQADEKSMQLGMTLAGMSDGLSMFDADLRLVQWNDRFADLCGLDRAQMRRGLSFQEVLRMQALAGEFGVVDIEPEIARRVVALQGFMDPKVMVRRRPNGSVLELRRKRQPDGGLVTLYSDITTRMQMEDAQSRAREQAEAAAQEKSRFVAIVSHEIRSPLNVALNSLALLEQSDLAASQRQLVSTGLLAGESLMSLLNDILDLSRMQVGRMQLRAAPFTLRPLLDGVVEMFRHQAEERGVVFSVVVAPGVPDRLMTDAGRLRQALMNLVNNAAKFAEPGAASIRVGFATLSGEAVLRFAVRDGGPDIPELDRAGLFRPFSQLAQPGSAGTGLGLAICQLLANLLGGQIGCDTLPHGKEFWLTLPADVMDVADEPQAHAEPIPDWLPRTRILLVEDIPANQVVVATALRRHGHMVDVASSGVEALDKLDRGLYDVVFLDIFMPGMDGLETARHIRATPGRGRDLPIVALTANTSADDKAAYLAAGMNDLVAKPVGTATLLRVLARQVWPGRRCGEPTVPPSPRPSAAPVQRDAIDRDRVQSWRGGLQAAVSDALFADCLRQLRDMVPAVQTALELQHAAALKRATHAIAGVAANYGLSSLAASVQAVAEYPQAAPPGVQAARLNHEIDRAEATVAALAEHENA